MNGVRDGEVKVRGHIDQYVPRLGSSGEERTTQMSATALGDAMERAGFNKIEMQFYAACTEFLKAGGGNARGVELLGRAEEELRRRGRVGHVRSTDQRAHVPSPQANRERGGQRGCASDGPCAGASPSREPTAAQRSAAGAVAKAAALTVLDTCRIDGRAVGDWTIGEAERAGRSKTREGAILLAATRVVANAPANALIRDVVRPKEMQIILQQAAEASDAA
jgi:hypothetical protein